MIAVAIKAVFIAIILAIASAVLYAIEGDICEFIDFLKEIFDMFAGLKPVKFTPTKMQFQLKGGELVQQEVAGNTSYEVPLLDAIFSNSTISNIYWDMALIGIVLVFAFALVAVVKKMFDMGDHMKQSIGRILGNTFKAIILILSMNIILSFTLQASQVLLTSVNEVFSSGESNVTVKKTFTQEQYGAMYRCINTIGNYSLNKSYNSRYNLNACYNDLVEDLQLLDKKNTFEYPYKMTVAVYPGQPDKDGNIVVGDMIYQTIGTDSWQSILYDIATCGPIAEVNLDSYSELRNEAILNAMDQIRNNNVKPLEYYSFKRSSGYNTDYDIGRVIMLVGSIGAARDSQYNRNMSFLDDLRKPYLYGEKDIYSKTEADGDFDYGLAVWKHLLVIILAIAFLKQYLGMVFSAAARVFNMVFLYLISPPFMAMMPLDDGDRAKQWSMAFIIQTISLFGNILAMRLFCILIPIVVQNNIVFFPDSSGDQMKAQVCFILACSMLLRKASGLITGILTGNGAGAVLSSSDMMSEGSETMGKMVGTVRKFSTMGFNMVKQGVSSFADKKQAEADKAAEAGAGAATGGASTAAGGAGGGGGGGGAGGGGGKVKDPTREFAEGALNMVDTAITEGVDYMADMATDTKTGGIQSFASMQKKDDDDDKKQGGANNTPGGNQQNQNKDKKQGGNKQDPLGRHGEVPTGAFQLGDTRPGTDTENNEQSQQSNDTSKNKKPNVSTNKKNNAANGSSNTSESKKPDSAEVPESEQPEQPQQVSQIPAAMVDLANGKKNNSSDVKSAVEQAVNSSNVRSGDKDSSEGGKDSSVSVNVTVMKNNSGSKDKTTQQSQKLNVDTGAIQNQIQNQANSESTGSGSSNKSETTNTVVSGSQKAEGGNIPASNANTRFSGSGGMNLGDGDIADFGLNNSERDDIRFDRSNVYHSDAPDTYEPEPKLSDKKQRESRRKRK